MRRTGLILLVAGCTLLAGCQRRQDAGQAPAPASAVTVTPGADGVQAVTVAEAGAGQYRFVPNAITVSVGKVRITFTNADTTPHNLTFPTLVDSGKRVALATTRGGAEESIDFAVNTPGQYRFVCTIHEALGQTGTLNVRR
jgi:plastocyanin